MDDNTTPLIVRLQQHYRNLAPHVKERATAKLLEEAIRRILDLEELLMLAKHYIDNVLESDK